MIFTASDSRMMASPAFDTGCDESQQEIQAEAQPAQRLPERGEQELRQVRRDDAQVLPVDGPGVERQAASLPPERASPRPAGSRRVRSTTAATSTAGWASQAQNLDRMPIHAAARHRDLADVRLAAVPSSPGPTASPARHRRPEKAAPNPGSCSGTKPGPVDIPRPTPGGALQSDAQDVRCPRQFVALHQGLATDRIERRSARP